MARNAKKDVDVLQVLTALGIDPDVAREALGVSQTTARAARKAIKVDVLTGEEAQKFGDVSVSKLTSNGRYIAKLGIFADDLPGFITELTAAQEAIAS
jgi:hypothetical protein